MCIVSYFVPAKIIKSRWLQQTGKSTESEEVRHGNVATERGYLSWSGLTGTVPLAT